MVLHPAGAGLPKPLQPRAGSVLQLWAANKIAVSVSIMSSEKEVNEGGKEERKKEEMNGPKGEEKQRGGRREETACCKDKTNCDI